jgi:carbonic anhydrase
MVKEGKLKVVAAKYDLDDGKVSLLISKQSPASPENAL